jgi:hypothetical protein
MADGLVLPGRDLELEASSARVGMAYCRLLSVPERVAQKFCGLLRVPAKQRRCSW